MNFIRDTNVALRVKFYMQVIGIIFEYAGWIILFTVNWKIAVGFALINWAGRINNSVH